MTKPTLQQALDQNAHLLGHNYANLGRGGNTYLSYTKDDGWGVVRPSLCQRWQISRQKADYPHLHIKHIAWFLYLERDAPAALKNRVLGSWDRFTAGLHSFPVTYLDETEAEIAPNPSENCRNVKIGKTLITLEEGTLTETTGVKAIAYGTTAFCDNNGGVSNEVFTAAGPALEEEIDHLPYYKHFMHLGKEQAVVTGSGNLAARGIERVIHVAGPIFNYGNQEGSTRELKQAYKNSLKEASEYGIRSIAFSHISPPNFGFDFALSLRTALQAIEEFAAGNKDDFNVIKIVFDPGHKEEAFRIFDSISHLGTTVQITLLAESP